MSAKETNAARARREAAMRRHDAKMVGAMWYDHNGPCPQQAEEHGMHVCVSSENLVFRCACGAAKRPMTVAEMLRGRARPSVW